MASILQSLLAMIAPHANIPHNPPTLLLHGLVAEPEANERGSSLIDRRLLYGGLKSLFPKREELWLWANEGFRMRSGIARDCGYA